MTMNIVKKIKSLISRRKNNDLTNEEKYYMASSGNLWEENSVNIIWRGLSLAILAVFYIGVTFTGFIAPQGLQSYDKRYTNAPPVKLHFIDESGKFHFQPLSTVEKRQDPLTNRKIFAEDREAIHPVYLFCKGEEYKFWGLFPSNIHLFGTKEEAPLFIFGTDSLGRDLFSRIIHGSRISLTIGFVGVFISLFIGIIMGGISGYFGVLLIILSRDLLKS